MKGRVSRERDREKEGWGDREIGRWAEPIGLCEYN